MTAGVAVAGVQDGLMRRVYDWPRVGRKREVAGISRNQVRGAARTARKEQHRGVGINQRPDQD